MNRPNLREVSTEKVVRVAVLEGKGIKGDVAREVVFWFRLSDMTLIAKVDPFPSDEDPTLNDLDNVLKRLASGYHPQVHNEAHPLDHLLAVGAISMERYEMAQKSCG